MSSWITDAAIQNHNGAGFNHLDPNSTGNMLDPSSFMGNNASFDPSQFQNQQLQQRMQNGGMRNGSPAFNQPVYQTNSVIPSKRPRPRDENIGTSPHQAPGMLPNSRSQTPQQQPQYSGFQPNNMPPQHPPQQTPYSHLQNGSANASPSPIMGNQLRPGVVPQRVSTASPHPFSPAGQFAPQASPSQSEHGSRVDTPTNPYAQNTGFAQSFPNQNFTPPSGRTSAPPQQMQQSQMQQPQMFNQSQPPKPQQQPNNPQAQMMYQMRLQQQLQQQQQQQGMIAAQRQNLPPNMNPLAKPQMQGPNGQMAGVRPQQPGQRLPPSQETFMKSLVAFMQSKSLPLDMNPIVEGRPILLFNLYITVLKFGGFGKVTSANGWSQVARALGLPSMQNSNAAQELRVHYERYLHSFEDAWQQNQQRQMQQRMMQQQNAAANIGGSNQQMSPTKSITPTSAIQQPPHYIQQQQLMAQQHQLQQQHAQTTPVKQMNPIHLPQQPAINGFSTPQAQSQHAMGSQGHARNSLSRSVDGTPQNGSAFPMPSPVSASKSAGLSLASPQVGVNNRPDAAPPAPQPYDLPAELEPKKRELDTFGGVEVESLAKLGDGLSKIQPDIPLVAEMGTIDIHALTMSLQSGIYAEVRLALDTILLLTLESRLQFELKACEDLVETLIDCAEVQVEFLAENAAEVSDVMLVNSYEDVVRGCRSEQELLQDIMPFGSIEYELDRAVDRLICITTIMRNLSFYEPNNDLLADELVIKFLCVVIRHLGTRNMLLRTHQNTLDFMKDIIIFLSNLAQKIELPGREQALCLLHFLLAFAPCPPPNTMGSDHVSFSQYDPAIHRYLPPAVDSLAKLLARDEPNRTHYKLIFASDVASSPPYDILTRTFGLAISSVPDDKQDAKRGNLVPVVEARKPFLMQGILAAEILSSLVPGFETGLAKSWLISEDGFAQNLTRLILSLCLETSPQVPHQKPHLMQRGVEDEALLNVSLGAIAVLRRLAEKCRDPDDPNSPIPLSGMPAKENLLGALEIKQPKLQSVLKQLCAYAGLDT